MKDLFKKSSSNLHIRFIVLQQLHLRYSQIIVVFKKHQLAIIIFVSNEQFSENQIVETMHQKLIIRQLL